MSVYLDDDAADRRLIAELRKAGHVATVPADANLAGATDARHLIHCLSSELTLLTRNHDDFLDLHEVVQAAQGQHFGILFVRFDNDPNRDMTARGIVTAIRKLEAAGVEIANQVHILNHWRS
jgi:hypothetical protein